MINTNKKIEIEGDSSDLTAVFVMYGIPPKYNGGWKLSPNKFKNYCIF